MLKRFVISLIVIVLNFNTLIQAHPWKPDHFVIIDTDGGFDDFRAINMLLASSSVRVLAIISSNGVISAQEGYQKINSMLKAYYNEGILIGMSTLSIINNTDCKPALDFKWGTDPEKSATIATHLDIINEILKNSEEQITFINLGSLSTYNSALKNIPSFKKRIKKTIWACNYKAMNQSFNYKTDTLAYLAVCQQNIKLSIVDGIMPQFSYQQIIEQDMGIFNSYAKNFSRSLKESSSPYSKKCYDETAVLYLHKPDYFEVDSQNSNIQDCRIKSSINSKEINKLIVVILDGQSTNQNQVFSVFPMDPNNYADEIKEIMPECLEKYGKNEWISNVMANEMHRHLGIYAIIGSKMGMRAREYFGAGIDEMKVVSFAGITPPFSCMNDGLQISTGATLGHGLISLKADSLKLPKAEFTYMNRNISIRLKAEYQKRVESEIKNLVILYGLDTNLYWDLVRNLAINYWKFWDRHKLFDLETVPSTLR